jgi:hypothetical protein
MSLDVLQIEKFHKLIQAPCSGISTEFECIWNTESSSAFWISSAISALETAISVQTTRSGISKVDI